MTSTEAPPGAKKSARVSATRARLTWVRDTRSWAIVRAATNAGVTYRVTGLAGEAAFFALLSLPPFVLGLIGVLSKLGGWIGMQAVRDIDVWVIEQAGVLSTAYTTETVVRPPT